MKAEYDYLRLRKRSIIWNYTDKDLLYNIAIRVMFMILEHLVWQAISKGGRG